MKLSTSAGKRFATAGLPPVLISLLFFLCQTSLAQSGDKPAPSSTPFPPVRAADQSITPLTPQPSPVRPSAAEGPQPSAVFSPVDEAPVEFPEEETLRVAAERNFHEFFRPAGADALTPDEPFLRTPGDPPSAADDPSGKPPRRERFHWRPAVIESLNFLALQQSLRMVQKKTRRELDGKFFADWGRSVRNLGGWRDGDSFLTNYIAHPMQGAVTGRIFINNSDRSKRLEFDISSEYWESRFKAMIWSAVWSTQFELGPLSEASIGNVGLYDRTGPNRMGWVDIVVTPMAGTAVIIGEDLIDKYFLRKWLERGTSRTRIKIFRTFFTPFQSFTNVLGGRKPWHRDNR